MKGSDQRIWLDADGTGNNASVYMTTDDAVNAYLKTTMNDADGIATFNDGTPLASAATIDAGEGAVRMAINAEGGPMHLMTGGYTRMFVNTDGQIGMVDLTTSGNDREFESNSTSPFFEDTVFPFMAVANEPSQSGSGCSVIPATANAGATALGSMIPFISVFGALGIRALRRKIRH